MSNIRLTFDFVLMGVVIYFAIYRFHFDSVDRPFWLLDPKYFFFWQFTCNVRQTNYMVHRLTLM